MEDPRFLSVDLLAKISGGMAYFVAFLGAGDGIRTRDIDLGKVALYQLSYSRAPQASPFSPAVCRLVK